MNLEMPGSVAHSMFARVLLVAALMHPECGAQDSSPSRPTTVISCPMPPPPTVQWLFDRTADVVHRTPAQLESAQLESGVVREVALTLLALLADGSTMRAGPYRQQVKELVQVLRYQELESGRFLPDLKGPLEIETQLWATLAVQQAAHLSSYRLLEQVSRRALEANLAIVPQPKDAGLEITIPLALSYEVAERAGLSNREPSRTWLLDWQATHRVAAKTALLPELAAHLLVAAVLARSERAQQDVAARYAKDCQREFSARLARGAKEVDELTLLCLGWCYMANDLLQKAGFEAEQLELALRAPAERAEKAGPDRGSVTPLGGWSTDVGRTGTTAMAQVLATMGYRYCRLAGD